MKNMMHKWLPVIDPEICNGCQECIHACGPDCFELRNGRVVLTRPDICGSEEHCIAPCPVRAIRMEWVPMEGNESVGKWR